MGFLSDLFGIGKRDVLESLNPLSGMKLLEFVVADDSSEHLRHYFRFLNKASQDEEFIVIYHRVGGDRMRYARTLWREPSKGSDFCGLNDRSPWWPAISRMIDMGQQMRPTQVSSTHFSLRVAEPGSNKPTPSPITNPSQPPRSPGRLKVDANDWQVTRGDTGIDGPPAKDSFSRSYSFGGLPPPDTTGLIRIECTIESGGLQRAADGSEGLSLNRSVRFYFRPFRLPKEMEFVLRLTTIDESEGGSFDAIASPVGNDTVVLSKFGDRNDTATLLRALMAGKDLKFELLQDDESLVKLPLPNDGTFKRLWDASAQRFAELEATYEILRSQRNPPSEPKAADLAVEVRKNPKGYNVWMVEQEPGEYSVLLVKVDRDGKMEDAWGIGETFSDRRSQGAFALDVARDLGIKLMDVVDR